VEGEGGRFRRNHCVPMPVVDSIEELNALFGAADDADNARRVSNRATSVGHDWARSAATGRADRGTAGTAHPAEARGPGPRGRLV
jgi:hypothetical protein